MPTLRLVYLTDQQYAGMMDHAHGAANNTTAAIPSSINQEQTRLPIADATRKGTKRKRRAPVKSFDLHLLGFDHENDSDAAAMESLEIQILTGHGVANPYSETLGESPEET